MVVSWDFVDPKILALALSFEFHSFLKSKWHYDSEPVEWRGKTCTGLLWRFFFLIFVNVLYCCNHYLHTRRLIPIGVIPYDSNWMHCHSTPTSPPSFYCSLCMNVPLGNTRGLERHYKVPEWIHLYKVQHSHSLFIWHEVAVSVTQMASETKLWIVFVAMLNIMLFFYSKINCWEVSQVPWDLILVHVLLCCQVSYGSRLMLVFTLCKLSFWHTIPKLRT